jgi:hypothetical protein
MTTAAAPPGLARRLWPPVRRFGVIRLALLLVALVAFAYIWVERHGRLPAATVWQVPLVIELLVLSLPWRVISTRTVLRFFMIGFGPVFLATVATQSLLVASPLDDAVRALSRSMEEAGIGDLGGRVATVWAPITEELWKIVPLIVAVSWGRSRLWSQGGPLDFALIAAATGAGMGLAEDVFLLDSLGWSTPGSPLLGLGAGTAWVTLVVNPLLRVPVDLSNFDVDYQGLMSVVIPSLRAPDAAAVWPGHGIMPMAFGLALGWAAVVRRRAGPRLALAIPAAVLAWSVWDHFIANWYRADTCSGAGEPALCGMARIDLTGAILPVVVVGMWVLATIAAIRLAARHAAADPPTRLARAELSTAAYRGSGPTWPLRFAHDAFRYLRLRNRVANAWEAIDRANGSRRTRLADEAAGAWANAALLAMRLRRPVPASPSSRSPTAFTSAD